MIGRTMPRRELPRWLNTLWRRTLCRVGLHRWEPVRFGGKIVPGRVCSIGGCRAWRSWWETSR